MKVNTTAIRIELAKKNWNLKDLACQSSIAYTTLICVMNGARGGNIKTIGKIAKGLGVDVTEILTDED